MPKIDPDDDVEMDVFEGSGDDVEVVNVLPPPLSMYTDLMRDQEKNISTDSGKRVYKKKITLGELYRYADGLDKFMILLSALCGIGSGIMTPMFILVLGDLVNNFGLTTDSMSSASGNMTSSEMSSVKQNMFAQMMQLIQDNILDCCKMMLILGAITFLLRFVMSACGTITAHRQGDMIRKKYFHAAISQEVGWFDSHQTGALTATLSDIQRIQDGLGECLGMLLQGVATFIGGVIVAFCKGWKMALVIVAMTPLFLFAVSFVMMTLTTLVARAQEFYARAGQVAEEVLSNIRTVVALGIQGDALKRYNENLNTTQKTGYKKGLAWGGSFGFFNFVLFSSFGLAFWYGGTLILDGEMTPGSVFMVFTGIMMGTMSVGMISPQMNKISDACGCASEVFGTIDRNSLIDPRKDDELDDEAKSYTIKGDIEFRDVCFRYPTRPEYQVLKNLDLVIPHGKTTALVGPSGCGKSTVVGLVERFYDCEEGFGEVLIDGRNIKSIGIKNLRRQIGIVSQEPVLFATTIAQNIAWGCIDNDDKKGADSVSMDEIKKAAKMANADGFISSLTDGYNTLVGQRGTQLSGGQKQRIAIARALIRKPKILIFDEATSALDRKSEAEVQEAIDKVASQCTCIIIAHRLSTIKNADQIAVFNNGKVVELGTHDELMAVEGSLYRTLVEKQQLAQEKEQEEKSQESKEDKKDKKKKKPSKKDDDTKASKTKSESEKDDDDKKEDKSSSVASTAPSDEEIGQLKSRMNKATLKTMMRAFKLLGPNTHWVIIAVIGAIVNGIQMPCFSLIISEMMQVLLYDPANPGDVTESEHDSDLTFWAVGFLVLGCICIVSNLMQYGGVHFASERLSHYLRYESFKAMLRQDMGWFDDKRNMTGVLTTRLASDATLVYDLTANQVMLTLQTISCFVSGFVVAVTGNWKIALVCLACVPVLLATTFYHMRVVTSYAQLIKMAYEESGRVASEALENVRTVVSLGREDTFVHQFSEQLQRPVRLGLRTEITHAVSSGIESLFQFWLAALAFWYGSELMSDPDENVEFADIMKAVMGMMFGASGVGQVVSSFPDFGRAVTATYNIFFLFDRKPSVPYPHVVDPRPIRGANLYKLHEADSERANKTMEKESKSGSSKRTLESVRGEIEFDGVTFSYPTRPDVPVLKGLSFKAKPKQTVALVGESGCGKSTTVNLLERLYIPSGGSIKLDGVPIDELEIGWLRSQIGIVSQEPVLFATSIYENIRYGKLDATKEEIENAAKMANAHNFICSFPQGYDTPVGEKGATLSGGQKQRIAIARALVRNPKVLLLDEATSALDSESEKVVQDALDHAREGRTTIVIAHRLSTIQNADLIVVIDDGAVFEQGTHKSLIENPKSLYASLANAQQDTQ